MSPDLLIVLGLLVASVAMFAIGRPRMDVVGILVIVALPITGILTVPETLAGFADPNVILIAALFVVGEGLSRTGLTHRLGDWLARTAGASLARTTVLLMLCVAVLGAIMSSTGVVAIFIPVALSLAARTGISPRQLMMPLSFAGLISGMLTLIATAPNLVVDAELVGTGHDGFDFFAPTPVGLVVLALGIGYMLVAQRFLSPREALGTDARRTVSTLLIDYGAHRRVYRYRVTRRSSLVGSGLSRSTLGEHDVTVYLLERTRRWRQTRQTTAPGTTIAAGDTVFIDRRLDDDARAALALDEMGPQADFFDTYSSHIGLAEVMISPYSDAIGDDAAGRQFVQRHDLVVLGTHCRRGGALADPRPSLSAGDTLLVAGPWEAITRLQTQRTDYLVLELPAEGDEVAPARRQAPFAILSLVVMITIMVTGVLPNVTAALIGALLMGVFRCIDMPSAYRAIHWPTLLLIVGMLPFALALKRTGAIDLAVDGILALFGDASPTVLLAVLFALTAIVGLFVSNTATAVLVAPIALTIAHELGASPLPFAMIVALAASSAFMTPVSSPVNTLVVEPGRYRFVDFVKIGTPFTVVVMVVSVTLVPVLMPLYPR